MYGAIGMPFQGSCDQCPGKRSDDSHLAVTDFQTSVKAAGTVARETL